MEYMALMASNLSLKVLATFTDFQKGLNKAKFCLKLTRYVLVYSTACLLPLNTSTGSALMEGF